MTIKDLRLQKNYTEKYVADYLGVSVSSVSLWESGKRKVNAVKLTKLAKLYKISLAKLVDIAYSKEENK